MKIFYGLVHKDKNSAFGITFPDAPGCYSAADEESDLLTNAQEALSLYVEGEAIPDARTIAELLRDENVAGEIASGAFVLAVPLIESRRKSRYNLMLDEDLVASVDRIAKVSGVSRSEFVAQAVQTQLSSDIHVVFSPRDKSGGSRSVTKAGKAVAASALTQKGAAERKSAKVASSATKFLKSKTASKKSRSASILTRKKK